MANIFRFNWIHEFLLGYVSDTEDSIQIQLDNDRLNANIRVDDPKSTPNVEDGGFMRNSLHGNRDSSEL